MTKGLYALDIDPSSNLNRYDSALVEPSDTETADAAKSKGSVSVEWMAKDVAYSKSLNDYEFVKKECYRTSFIDALKDSIRVFDGHQVTSKEKRSTTRKTQTLRGIVKGREKYFKEFAEANDVDESLENRQFSLPPADLSSIPEELVNGKDSEDLPLSPFRDWKPVSRPLSTLSNRVHNVLESHASPRIEIPTPYRRHPART